MKAPNGSARCWPLYKFARGPSLKPPPAWVLAVVLHVIVFGAIAISPYPAPQPVRFVALEPEPVVPPFAGVRPGRGTHTQLGRKPVVGESVVTVTPRDTVVPPPPAAPAPATPRSGWILPPQLGDGRLWVSPRPALPVEVADAIYGEHPAQDSLLVRRLRAMVDSLNLVIDAVQRAHQLPSWTTKGDNGKPMWGIDQGGIYVAGVKIPTAGLALLGSLLPPGNYDESVRQRHLADMRDDIMRAAARAQTFDDFRRYVRELRARKQAERDAERRQHGDTASVQP